MQTGRDKEAAGAGLRAVPAAGRSFAENRRLQFLLGTYAAVWTWAAIDPVYRFDWFLENILAVLFAAGIVATYGRFRFSDLSYLLIFLFMALHAVGGHYTYSEVPFGFWLRDTLGFERNNYDRIVHFSFGLLLAYPAREAVLRLSGVASPWASAFALSLVFAFSGSFEIIEWMVAVIVSPEAGAAYLGTQGDEFDAQKDVALAAGGAVIALGLTALASRRREAR